VKVVLRDDGRVGDGRVRDEQSLELGRRYLRAHGLALRNWQTLKQ
jgi:hypothetical protein